MRKDTPTFPYTQINNLVATGRLPLYRMFACLLDLYYLCRCCFNLNVSIRLKLYGKNSTS